MILLKKINKSLDYWPNQLAIISFFILLIISIFLTYRIYNNEYGNELIKVKEESFKIKNQLESTINYSSNVVKVISFIAEKNLEDQEFEPVAKNLVEKNKYVDGIQLVKGFQIIKTYPFIGNEATIGYDLSKDKFHNKAAKEAIAQIEVAASEKEVALIFRHLEPLSESDQQTLISFCQTEGFSLYLQPGNNQTVHKVWPQDNNPYLTYTLPAQDLTFAFHPMDFTQVNAVMNQKMISQALALLDPKPEDTILDLFCGLGNFSLPFAKYAKQVVGVEGSEQAVSRAKENAVRNGLMNTEFYACNLEEDCKQQPFAKGSYHKIILDPPRSGAQKIVEEMAYFAPKQILYVSCNSATFVRDAAILVHQHGYKLAKLGVMDMFPQTAHVETMGLFVAGK